MKPALRFAGRLGLPCPPWPSCLRLTAVALLLGSALSVAAQASAQPLTPPQALASDYGCMTCHGLVRKQVGPGFAQIAARYQGDAQAAARLAAKIRNGSVGAWGRVVMPRQTRVSEADALALAVWVLSQPPQP